MLTIFVEISIFEFVCDCFWTQKHTWKHKHTSAYRHMAWININSSLLTWSSWDCEEKTFPWCPSALKMVTSNFGQIVVVRQLRCHNRIPQTEGLKQQKCIFPQFWWLEVQNQGATKFHFSRDLSCWLVDRAFSPALNVLFSMGTQRERGLCSLSFFS